MDEFWVCQHCRSLNRAGTGRCYHCKQSFGSKPKASEAVVRGGAPSANVTPFPPGPAQAAQDRGPSRPPFSRQAAASSEAPDYVSTPVMAAPAPVTDFSTKYREAASTRRRFPRPELTGWLRRRISNAMIARPYVGVTGLGYLTAALITLLLVDGAMLVATFTPVARTALANASIDFAMQQVAPSNRWILQLLVEALVVVGLLALLAFSLFVGLSTHNAVGLGASGARLMPGRAMTAWFGMIEAQTFIGAGMIVPAILIWNGYPVPGLIVALVAVEIAQRHMDDPFGWLTQPASHLAELYANLGSPGKTRSITATLWRYAFMTAHGLAIVACLLPVVVVAGVAIRDVTGHRELFDWPGPAGGPLQIACTAILGLTVLASATALGLLVPITIELVERQKSRHEQTLRRSRPWAGRPEAAAAAAAAASAMADELDEHPAPPASPWLAAQLERRQAVDTGAQYGAADDQGWDQASLNSPSTTSSFPWELGASSEDDSSD